MTLAERALGRFADGGKGGNEDVVERLALGQFFPERLGAGLQCLVGQFFELTLERVDVVDPGLIALDPAVVGGAEELAGERADPAKFLLLRPRRAAVSTLFF